MLRMKSLRRIREDKGYSVRSLAEASGIAPDTIHQVENGRRRANPSTRRKLATALGVPVEELAYDRKMPAPPEVKRWLEEHAGHAVLGLSEQDYAELVADLSVDDAREMAELIKEEHRVILERLEHGGQLPLSLRDGLEEARARFSDWVTIALQVPTRQERRQARQERLKRQVRELNARSSATKPSEGGDGE
jgi:transcriptional regulator with XRE-family HTH domain